MWKPARLLSPRFGYAKPPPFGKGGFGLCIHYHRSNDTGLWRGSNHFHKAILRNCPRWPAPRKVTLHIFGLEMEGLRAIGW